MITKGTRSGLSSVEVSGGVSAFVNASQCHVVAYGFAYEELPLSGSVSTLHLILCQYNIKEQY